MELWLLIAYVVVNTFLLGVVILVLSRNHKNSLNRSFSYLSMSVIVWSILNLFSNFTSFSLENLLLINHILLAVASLMAGFLVIFCIELLDFKRRKMFSLISILLAIAGSILALTPYMVDSVSLQGRVVALNFGPLAFLYFLSIGMLCLLVVAFLVYAVNKRNGVEKQRALIILATLLVTVSLTITTNLIVPVVTGDFTLTLIGPLFIVFLLGGTGYAIVKHKLFDVRVAAARSLAYLLSVATLVIIYGVVAYSLVENVFNLPATDISLRLAYTAVAVLLAITFQPIKAFFDKATDHIFFRNDYDLDGVLSEIGNATVEQTDFNSLIKDSQRIFNASLKPTYITALIFPKATENNFLYFKSGKGKNDRPDISSKILQLINQEPHSIITRESQDDSVVGKFMKSHEIEIIVRMKTTSEVSGYIFFGQKQNGSIYRKKDMQLLATAGDELALAFQNALRFEEIREFNRTLQDKVEQATTQLRRTNAKLHKLDEAKDEFISMASHQLRTPLTSVKGYLSMVLEGDAGDVKPSQKRLLEEAYAGSQRMVYLIGDFLNVSRIKTGKFVLEYIESNLAALVDDEINQLRDTAARRRIKLVYHAPDSLPLVRFDENKIRQVVMNLTDNAIYYSKPGGTIDVELFKKDDQMVFKVKDLGIGVPAKEQKDLFEKFYRATNARKVRPDGTGIGLFMIKKVVIAHGGSIIFESVENKGSTFGFTLPIRAKKITKKRSESPQLAEK